MRWLLVFLVGCGNFDGEDITGTRAGADLRSADAGSATGDVASTSSTTGDLASAAGDLASTGDLGSTPAANDGAAGGGLPFSAETTPAGSFLVALWGSAATDVYALSNQGDILHSAGDGVWSMQRPAPATTTSDEYFAIGGSGADDIYVTGTTENCGSIGPHCQGLLFHSTGDGQWAARPSFATGSSDPIFIFSISALGKTDVYLGANGPNQVYHSSDGMSWSFAGISGIHTLFVAAPDAVYAAYPGIARSDGSTTWSTELSSSGGLVPVVGGTSATDVYAVGKNPTSNELIVYHSTGNSTWSPQPTGIVSQTNAQAIGFSSAHEIYVSDDCQMLRSTGDGSWQVAFTPPNCQLRGLYVAPNGEVFTTVDRQVFHKR